MSQPTQRPDWDVMSWCCPIRDLKDVVSRWCVTVDASALSHRFYVTAACFGSLGE
jgi:hypothetical protein